MSLSPNESPQSTDWLDSVDVLGGTVGSLFPRAFQHLLAIEHPGCTGSLPEDRVVELLRALRSRTDTSTPAFYCVWNGWGGSVYRFGQPVILTRGGRWRLLRPRPKPQGDIPGMAYREIRHRTYFVFEGTLDDAAVSHDRQSFQSANMWWPADRSWFVATEIDAEATYIGLDDENTLGALATLDNARQVRHSDPVLFEPLP